MEFNFSGKVILITGAGQGIGNELCKSLHKSGAIVIAVSRSPAPLKELQVECPGLLAIEVDLSDWSKTREALKDIKELDGLVNNAGIAIIKPIAEITEEDFDKTFNINAKAVFNVTQFLAPKIKDNGSIVNVSSVASTTSFDGHSVYSATKAAVDSLTKSFALELGPRRIRVNSVNPTVILTRMGRDNWSDPVKADPVLKRIPLRKFGEVHEVVNSICYLLSDAASFVNGVSLPLEGGFGAC